MLVEGALLGEDDGDAVGGIVGLSLGSLATARAAKPMPVSTLVARVLFSVLAAL